MNRDGTNVQRLTNDPGNDTSPSWSPDGSKIAFISNRDGTYAVWAMSATGTDLVKVTSTGQWYQNPT